MKVEKKGLSYIITPTTQDEEKDLLTFIDKMNNVPSDNAPLSGKWPTGSGETIKVPPPNPSSKP